MASPLLKRAAMQSLAKHFIRILLGAILSAWLPAGSAITMAELEKVPNLTPEKLAGYFTNFEFKFHAEVQDHDIFLRNQSGDCDDYATVASEILSKNGYTTRLIAIRMKGETHVVCYVNETQSYLDYNFRKDEKRTVSCDNAITEIAQKVAQSFQRHWIATYQFTFNATEGVKRLVQNIISNRSVEKAG